ncbi:uncharacterized protein LOC122320093 [Drosophila ficusphila]|uniref:uncharacterized protein LOC122320093 n=1 Tax=Drosophila ficusphila TaxID=30025 RepID=UPI001C890C36|nr:uncharacterized protein LOC122320093 [Drosophila ficusphila]
MIEEKYYQCVGAVLKMLSNVSDVAFTCDAVTVPNSSRSFLTITAHFIEKDSLNSICLASSRMDQISDVPKPKDCFDDFMTTHNHSITKELSGVSEQNKELKLYFSLPQAAWECNPLEVWKSQRATMPGLCKVAMRHLITPGSSVPSERLASAIKCVVCDARSRMTDIHVSRFSRISPRYCAWGDCGMVTSWSSTLAHLPYESRNSWVILDASIRQEEFTRKAVSSAYVAKSVPGSTELGRSDVNRV